MARHSAYGTRHSALGTLARIADGGLDPIWPIAALVYPVMTIVDIAWGGTSCSLASWVAATFART